MKQRTNAPTCSEASDHFTQSEVDEMNAALQNAEQITNQNLVGGGAKTNRGFLGISSSAFGGGGGGCDFISLVSKMPGGGDGFAAQARSLKAASDAQEVENKRSEGNVNLVPGMSPNVDP